MLTLDQRCRSLHGKVVHEFNRQLAKAVRQWRTDLDSVNFPFV